MMPTDFSRLLLSIGLLAVLASGCGSSRLAQGKSRPPDAIELQECIRLMDMRKIWCGMDTNQLKQVFGRSLEFADDNRRAYANLIDPRTPRFRLDAGWPAGWRIHLTISA